MRERVIGIENEYYIVLSHIPASDTKVEGGEAELAESELLRKLFDAAAGARQGALSQDRRLWLRNGGCIYVDMTKVIESASPECRRIRDVVLYNKVGERAVTMLSKAVSGRRSYVAFKTNVASSHGTDSNNVRDHVSRGCHENYMLHMLGGMLSPSASSEPYLPLVPFFVTRQVYGGSGWWEGGRGDSFWRSQRACFTTNTSTSNTTGNGRGIINLRNEALTSLPEFGRFHVIVGDANMLEYGLYLKIGATALMVGLMEEGLLPRLMIQATHGDPQKSKEAAVHAFHALAKEADLKRKMLLVKDEKKSTWQRMSPLEIQTMYLELLGRRIAKARFSSEEQEHEARRICAMWDETLAALFRNDADFLTGRIDWYTKRRIAATQIERKKRSGERCNAREERMNVDVLYHEIGDDTMYTRLVKRGVAKRIVTDEEIEQAIHEPPPPTGERGTRATVRGRAIREALRVDRDRPFPFEVAPAQHWDAITYQYRSGDNLFAAEKIQLLDPLAYTSKELDVFLASDWDVLLERVKEMVKNTPATVVGDFACY